VELQIFCGVLCLLIWANHEAEKDSPLLCRINHLVGIDPLHIAVKSKEFPGYPLPVFTSPVLIVADGCFDRFYVSRIGCCSYNCHSWNARWCPLIARLIFLSIRKQKLFNCVNKLSHLWRGAGNIPFCGSLTHGKDMFQLFLSHIVLPA
jgi:hypothetical protein